MFKNTAQPAAVSTKDNRYLQKLTGSIPIFTYFAAPSVQDYKIQLAAFFYQSLLIEGRIKSPRKENFRTRCQVSPVLSHLTKVVKPMTDQFKLQSVKADDSEWSHVQKSGFVVCI
jgi:hypothetical protein